MAIPAFLPAALGAGLGIIRYGQEQKEYGPRKDMYARMAAAGRTPPNMGVMNTPSIIGNITSGAMGGMGLGEQLGMTNVGQAANQWWDGLGGQKSPNHYGDSTGWTSAEYSDPYVNDEFVGPPTRADYYEEHPYMRGSNANNTNSKNRSSPYEAMMTGGY